MKQMNHKREVLESPVVEPATTDEGRIAQLTALAYDAAEQRIRNGTASSMEIVYFLKLGSAQTKLEQKKLESETMLKQAQIEALKAQVEHDDLAARAIDAMKGYKVDEDE